MQGAGGGGLLALSSIIVSDLVTLQERGTYNGFIGMYVDISCIQHVVSHLYSGLGLLRHVLVLLLAELSPVKGSGGGYSVRTSDRLCLMTL